MSVDFLKKIELEITSDCNAACPGCLRTQRLGEYKIQSFTFKDLQSAFPKKEHIAGKAFKFCGVLGDPAANVECLDMVRYLATNGGRCQLSTNGGIRTEEWWRELGKVGKETQNVDVVFCIDGHAETNHIYRVNTKFSVIERNVKAYIAGGEGIATGTWIFIVFDHNEYELDTARRHAAELGLKFATRTGMRNSYQDWLSQITKKQNGKIVKEEKIVTTTGAKEHSKVAQVQRLDKFIEDYSSNKEIDKNEKDAIIKSITCKYIHEGEIFISADLKVWPCCFLWTEFIKNGDKIVDKLAIFSDTWNSLRYHTVEEILSHPWYTELLELSWDPKNSLHLTRCVRTCGMNKAYHNEIKIEGN
jgi:MoaA/NifB/PqqE/SkfB family radical SAM enzyme